MPNYAKKGAEIENGVLTEARRQLCFELVGEFDKLDEEQRVQATEALQNVACAIGLTSDERAATALVSKDKGLVESVIIELREREGLAYLAVAILLHLVISNGLYRSLYGHHTAAMYIRDIDRRLGLYPSKVCFLVRIGEAFCEHWPELLRGVDDEPGIPLGELATRHRAKLSIYLAVRGICGARDALRCLKSDTFAMYQSRLHANELPKPGSSTVVGASTTTESAGGLEEQTGAVAENAGTQAEDTAPQVSSPRTFMAAHPSYLQVMAGFNEHQVAATRIVQRGGRPYLAIADRPEYLEGLDDKIEARRHTVNEVQRERIGHVAFEPQDALLINDALFHLDNVHDIEDRIRIGLTGVAGDRRTVAVLVARLESEEVFRYLWKDNYRSFARYARLCLGIEDELRDLIRVGRNILKYPVFFYGGQALDSEVSFMSLRHLDDAMTTYHGDVELIRARIRMLTCREFAEFATDASFEDRHASKAISFRQENILNGFFAQIAHYQGIGQSIKVVEVLADYEIPHIERFIRETRAAYEKAQDVTAEVTITTDGEVEALPIEALSPEEEKMLYSFPNIDGRKTGAITTSDVKVVNIDDYLSAATTEPQPGEQNKPGEDQTENAA